MNSFVWVLVMLLAGSQEIGGVKSSFDKNANFGGFRTYAWAKGQEAFDPTAHKTIVDAIDGQLAALGLTKADAATADVIVKYHTSRGSDVDLKDLEKAQRQGTDAAPTKILGTLVVVMYPPKSTTPLWQAHTRKHLSNDPATRTAEIQRAVAALFDTYPGKKKTNNQAGL